MFESFSQYIFNLSLLQEHLKLLLTHCILQKKIAFFKLHIGKDKEYDHSRKTRVTVFRHLITFL